MTTTQEPRALAWRLAQATPEQRAAIDVVSALCETQAAELADLHEVWPGTNRTLCEALMASTDARFDAICDAYREVHRAYGGTAPLAVTVALTESYYARLGYTPDVGVLAAQGPVPRAKR